MNRSHPKLKPPPRPFFSCGIFRNCTQSVLSPTAPAAELPPPPTSSAAAAPQTSSSSSSSSSASQSFTQWRFPLHHHDPPPLPPPSDSLADDSLAEAFRFAEHHFSSGARIPALRLLERSLAKESAAAEVLCPAAVMAGVVAAVRDPSAARAGAKVLLALLLAEGNRGTAAASGAAEAAVGAVSAAGATAERALAALELLCTTAEGAERTRGEEAAAAALAGAVEGMPGRARECALGVVAAIYGGDHARAAPPEVEAAVAAAMQGECSARGRRKGEQLLRALQEAGLR